MVRLEEIEAPVPRAGEILVEVHAAAVNRTDCHLRAADPFLWRLFTGLRRPRRRVLGTEYAGVVASVGSAVRGFAIGEEVFGITGGFGAHAEYLCVRASGSVAHKPAGLSFIEAAAALDGPTDARAKLRRLGVEAGDELLVYGASGSIGTAAVQLGRELGAEVTAVCAAKNLELVRSLGADRVIDYGLEDFAGDGARYDAIFDAVGLESFRRCKGALKLGGRYTATDGWMNLVSAFTTRFARDKRVVLAFPQRGQADILAVKELIDAGAYRPVIDRTYPFEEIVQAARYVETKQKTGNVVLVVRLSGDGGQGAGVT